LMEGELVPLVYNEDVGLDQSIYQKNGINFDRLLHLSSIGLISFESAGYVKAELNQQIEISYHKTNLRLEFKKPRDNELSTGNVLLTNIGNELAQVCSSKAIDGFIEYVINKFSQEGIVISPPYPRKDT